MNFVSRCGNCSSQNLYGNDVCNLPTPTKYNECYQKTYSDFNSGCEPGYTVSCDYQIEGSRTLLCCPNTPISDNLYDIECNTGVCKITIAYQNKKLECSSAESLLACLDNPDSTYVDGVKNDFPIPWLIYPKEIYNSLKTLASPCAGSDDYNCLPYSEIINTDINGICPSGKLNNYAYFNNSPSCTTLETKGNCIRTTNSTCVSGMTEMSTCTNSDGSILCCTVPTSECYSFANFIPNNSSEQNIFCQMTCPSYNDQLFIGVETPCDASYYDLCKQSGCTIDPVCEANWNLQQITNGILMPNRLPTVVSE